MRTAFISFDLLDGRVVKGTVRKGFVPTTLADHFADAGNGGTAETDLYSDSVPVAALANNGDKVEARYGGTFVASGTATRVVRVYFAEQLLHTAGPGVFAAPPLSWTAYLTVVRVDVTTVRYMVTFATASTTVAPASVGELTGIDLTTTNVLKVTGQAGGTGAATNDIVAKLGYVEYKPKA